MTGQATGDAAAALDQAFESAVETVAGDTDSGANDRSDDTDEAADRDEDTADGAQDTDSDEDAGGEDEDDEDDAQDSDDEDDDDAVGDDEEDAAGRKVAKPQDPDDEAFESLTEKQKQAFRNLPPEVRKANDAYFTRRAQAFSSLEQNAQMGAQLIEAIKRNPRAALLEAAETLGVQLVPQAPDAEVQALLSSVENALKDVPEIGGEKAKTIAAALAEAVKLATKPAKDEAAKLVKQTSLTNATSAFTAFAKTHPDWKKYEPQLNKLLDELPRPDGVKWETHLDRLYVIASRGAGIARATKKAVNKSKEAAARRTGSDRRPTSTSSKRVAPAPPSKFPTLEEAAEAASQGIQWEHS